MLKQTRPTILGVLLILLSFSGLQAQFTSVGSGSYTTGFPGTDAAGRNTFPSGTAYTTGNAIGRPVPTNDWWSAKIKNSHADNLFNYPFTLKTKHSGLVVTYIPWGVIDNIEPVIVGVSGLNASAANVSDFSDWTVSMNWQNAAHNFTATTGIGMPFLYFTKDSADLAQITVNQGTVNVSNEMLVVTNARNGADFAIYAPTGSTWQQSGNTYTSSLNGKNYWSMAFIPLTSTNVTATANAYKRYAYVFPTNSTANWTYNSTTSVVKTDFIVSTEVKEGSDTNMLIGLLPHQWAHLSPNSPSPTGTSYATVRGELKTLVGNRFSVSNTFHGILPTLPYLDYYSGSFDPAELDDKIKLIQNDQLPSWTDSYNEGQLMNRLIQTARVAALTDDSSTVNTILNTVKTRLEDWLKSEPGERAFLFYYNQNWTTLIGYPAGHGQDGNINDHHFHWGYFIHAAAFIEQYNPGWASQWGSMINLLVRDAASDNRNDNLFPFLRNFSPYAGHCWANGFASFPQGNDQESTSESMQFNSSLIHWGSITNNTAIRDLGIYLYTTEQTAIEEYWFDQHNRIFGTTQQYSLVSRVWGNSYDNGTFWTNDIAASYGIELYPIHGGSFYLGHDTNYVSLLWNEIESNTGILSNAVNPNLWHDIMWEYLAFYNPQKAIQLYNSYPNRSLKFGVSDAQTYHWLHAMNTLGIIDISITADHPIAAVFSKNGVKTYVAHNYSTTATTVNFSDGFSLTVPARSMATSRDIPLKGTISAPFSEVYPGGSSPLQVSVTGGVASKVEFLRGDSLIGQDTTAPFELTAHNIPVGKHKFYARIYQGNEFNLSNLIDITAGEQLPFRGTPVIIPGIIEAGNYDIFEGGSGSEIAYFDSDPTNNGDFRLTEKVDASTHPTEGNIIGWTTAGEWLEYTTDVQQAGFYTISYRYACGNPTGGGPFHLLLGKDTIASSGNIPTTNDWNTWQSRNISFVPLKSGQQVLRILFEDGEINLGKLTFTFTSTLLYSQPVANAGTNQLIQIPQDSTTLDGSSSIDPWAGTLQYKWEQIYGPSVLSFSDDTIVQPNIKGLIEGVYLVRLTVNNGTYSDDDEVYIISSNSTNVSPKVSINAPFDQSIFLQSDTIQIAASATDLNGTIRQVSFYANSTFINIDTTAPYQTTWVPTPGNYSITAIALDDDSASTTSAAVNVRIDPAPPCRDTSSNGEFLYEFSAAKDNPTLTFIPTLSGMGNPTCILYYGTTNSNTLPGYIVTPNIPFQINASQGTQIYFYYTYSYPGQGQHNNSANKDSYIVGSCSPLTTSIQENAQKLLLRYYPNPVTEKLTIELENGKYNIWVYNSSGSLLENLETEETIIEHDMSSYPSGIYFFKIISEKGSNLFKVVK